MTVVLVSASLALVGCQEGPEPAGSVPVATPTVVTGSGTGTASSTSSPTGTADPGALAAVPKAARTHTSAGAQAFAEFYVHQINGAWSVPDPTALREYGLASCKSCQGYVGTAASLTRQRHRYDGDAATILASSWYPESKPNLAVVRIVLQQLKRQIVDERGDTVSTTGHQRAELEFSVAWSEGRGWSISEIQQVVQAAS